MNPVMIFALFRGHARTYPILTKTSENLIFKMDEKETFFCTFPVVSVPLYPFYREREH